MDCDEVLLLALTQLSVSKVRLGGKCYLRQTPRFGAERGLYEVSAMPRLKLDSPSDLNDVLRQAVIKKDGILFGLALVIDPSSQAKTISCIAQVRWLLPT